MAWSPGGVRVSTDRQAELGTSLEAQEPKIRAMATLRACDLTGVIVDGGDSAKGLKRPGIQQLLALIEGGNVDALILAKLDRLTRSVKDLCALRELFEKRKVALISVAESLDTTDCAHDRDDESTCCRAASPPSGASSSTELRFSCCRAPPHPSHSASPVRAFQASARTSSIPVAHLLRAVGGKTLNGRPNPRHRPLRIREFLHRFQSRRKLVRWCRAVHARRSRTRIVRACGRFAA